MDKDIFIGSCPYCGGCNCRLEKIKDTLINGRTFFLVICGMCGASGPIFDEERAIYEWNKLSIKVIPSFNTVDYRDFLANEWLEWMGKGKINDRN